MVATSVPLQSLMAMATIAQRALHPLKLQEFARSWLVEDASGFDFAGVAVEDQVSEFAILVKSPGILAGIPFANAVFTELGLQPHWFHEDGDNVTPIKRIAVVKGPAKHLLLSERIVLNILSRASGVATLANNMVSTLREVEWKGHLAGTRKTTPGFRMVEKYALLVGGADTHRYDISEMVMLKDNHLVLNGSIKHAVEQVKKYSGFSRKIEVECRTLGEALEAAEVGANIVMLDNFEKEDLHKTAKQVKCCYPNILIEASGGVNEDNVLDYASPDIDIISSSSLVQGYKTLDISMKVA